MGVDYAKLIDTVQHPLTPALVSVSDSYRDDHVNPARS